MTESGKTFLAKDILKDVPRLVVVDTKGNLGEAMNLIPATRRNWRKFIMGENMRLQLIPPESTKLSDLSEWVDRNLWLAYKAGNCIVFIDESHHIAPSSTAISPALTALYTRGREPIKDKKGRLIGGNIGVIACAQRPSRIPLFLMTESTHFFVFRLQDGNDRDRMSEYAGKSVRRMITDQHGFFYYKNSMGKPVYIREYKAEG